MTANTTTNLPLPKSATLRASAPRLAASLIATALVGCTVLTSELPSALDKDARAPEGVHYYLPKFVLDLTLAVDRDRATFSVSAGTPTAIADKDHRYYLNYVPLPQYEDKITIALSPKQGFLKSVTANTTDKTSEIIKNLARVVGALESAGSRANEEQLTKVTIDPADPAQLARAAELMNTEARNYAKALRGKVCAMGEEDQTAGFILDVQRRARCEAYKSVLKEHAHVALAFEPLHGLASRCRAIKPSHDDRSTGYRHQVSHRRHVKAAAPATRADCTVGICYRPAVPHELCLTAGRSVARQVLMVPNSAPVVEIDINRAFLVNKTQVITFNDDGMLESMQVTKASELLALSALPLEVIDALAEGMQFRVKIIDQQIAQSGASKDLIEARAGLEKQRGLLESAASMAGGRTSAASYSGVPTGARSSLPVTQSSGSVFDRVKPLN